MNSPKVLKALQAPVCDAKCPALRPAIAESIGSKLDNKADTTGSKPSNAEALLAEICFDRYRDFLPEKAGILVVIEADPAYSFLCRSHIDQIRKSIPVGCVMCPFGIENDINSMCQQISRICQSGQHAGSRSVVCVAPAFRCGWLRLALQARLPGFSIVQRGYPLHFEDASTVLSPLGAWMYDVTRVNHDILWNEFLRIQHQGSRGDIAYPPEVRAKVDALNREIEQVHIRAFHCKSLVAA